MSRLPRASLGRVIDGLGTTLLELVHGDIEAGSSGAEIGGVAIHDPVDELELPPHALVLGVGVCSAGAIAALLRELGTRQAAGLVVRAPVPSGPLVEQAAAESGVALLGLTRGASWTQLAALLRSLLAEGDIGLADQDTLGGLPAGDLFAMANAVAALLDAPVTIEDRSSRVLAFSGRQDEADPGRVETILGRQVPERYSRMLAERGVFRDLYRSAAPVYVDSLPSEGEPLLPRVAMAVRAGDEVLGSIWAAVRGPLSAERSLALSDAAKLVALHLLRVRAGSDVERRLRADLLGTALEGGVGARDALSRLGLAEQPVMVLALAVTEPAPPATAAEGAALVRERQRLGDAFAMHLSAVHPRSAAALIGDVAYALVPLAGDPRCGEERAEAIATEFLDRIGDRSRAVVAIGPVARNGAELARARVAADRVLRVLRDGNGSRRTAHLSAVYVETLISELRDLAAARNDQPAGAVARLLDYDADHNARLVDTLRAWLDAFGDVNAAAARLYVHPNTFRYRLRRVREVGDIDLDNPDARFAAMLQLRVLVPDR